MPIIKKAPEITTREIQTGRARQRTPRRLRPVHREQCRPRHQCRPEESPLAGPGLPQVARTIARHRPALTRPNPPKREERPDATNSRIARFHLGHSRYGRGSVPCSHPPLSRSADLPCVSLPARSACFLEFQIPLLRAPVHHPVSGLLDRALRRLHLHAESAPRHLAGTPSGVSRSEQERRALSRRRRSAQPPQTGARQSTHLAHHSRARIVYRNRHLGRDRKRQNLLLHAPVCRADSRLQSSRQRKADRRSCSWR